MMLSGHLLLMVLSGHLLLMMLSGHLLLMMLNIHLLLMAHCMLLMSGAFVLCSFFVHPGPMLFAAHSCSLAVMFSDVPRLVLSFPRSSFRCSSNALSALTLARAFALASAFALVE